MLNHEIEGNGPPLLLIHGFGVSFHIWQELRPCLRDYFTLIMVELPGIGRSPFPHRKQDYLDVAADEIEELREALQIESWRVLSYSSGTRVAERYLKKHAEHVERALFLCPLQARFWPALNLRIVLWLDRRYSPFGDWIVSGFRLRYLIHLLGFNFKKHPLEGDWFDEMVSQPAWILKETMHSLPKAGTQPFSIPELPALFIWGREDLISGAPRATAHDVFIHANHSAPQTAAQEVLNAALPFLFDERG
ncbi:MAG TPA: alpha/beta hydrolase [Anaerolineales bacterium]|nr:alpha/beta hydrolase [Anaerolineales bacterium]